MFYNTLDGTKTEYKSKKIIIITENLNIKVGKEIDDEIFDKKIFGKHGIGSRDECREKRIQ